MGKNKKTGILVLILAAIFVFSSCGSENEVRNYDDSAGEVTTITFFGNKYEPENVTVIEEIISGFMDQYPNIRVSYESLKGEDYFTALTKRMAAGKGDDVFMVNHDIALELNEQGQLAELSELGTIENYSQQMKSQMTTEGKIYWLPTTVSAFGLYCNVDLLKEHDQKIPENLKEWEAVCDYFVQQGITPIIANNDISLKTLAIGKSFYSVYQKNEQEEVMKKLNDGSELLSESLSVGFTLAEKFIRRGYIDGEKALKTEKTSDDLEEFIKGESPFMLTGAWASTRVKSMNPDFAFQVVPYPVLDEGSLVVVNADTRLAINADSEHRDAAVKFVEYFTQTENIQKFADQQSSFSPLNDGKPSSVQEIEPLISCYNEGHIVIGSDSLLDLPIWELTKEASQQLLSGKSLQSVMKNMDLHEREKGGGK